MYRIEAKIYIEGYYDMDVTCMAGCALKDANVQQYVEDNAYDIVYDWYIHLKDGVPNLSTEDKKNIDIEVTSVTPVEHWCEKLPEDSNW